MTMYGVSKRKSFGYDSRPFALQQNDIEKHITNRLHYFKNVQKQLDAQATKASSIALRKQWLEKQKKMNYQNEYDRIRGEIARQTVFRGGTSLSSLKERIKQRIQQRSIKMTSLFANAICFNKLYYFF